MFLIKPGAKILGIKPEILLGLKIVEKVFSSLGYDVILTEATGGMHMHESLHYVGLAVDLRSKHMLNIDKTTVIAKISSELEDFDFIIENEGTEREHFHLEFQPKD